MQPDNRGEDWFLNDLELARGCVIEKTPFVHAGCRFLFEDVNPHRIYTYIYNNNHCRIHRGTDEACAIDEKDEPSMAFRRGDACPKCEAEVSTPSCEQRWDHRERYARDANSAWRRRRTGKGTTDQPTGESTGILDLEARERSLEGGIHGRMTLVGQGQITRRTLFAA